MIKTNVDFPQIVVNSIPAPELIGDIISESDLEPYISGLRQLDSFGIDFIVMACNTIHLFYERLQNEVATPILDLRSEVESAVKGRGIKSVLLIGTPNTLNAHLYEFKGIECVKPNTAEVGKISNAIFNFNNGTNKTAQSGIVGSICRRYISNGGIEAVILGCTELGLMMENIEYPKIDTMDVLLEAVVRMVADAKTE